MTPDTTHEKASFESPRDIALALATRRLPHAIRMLLSRRDPELAHRMAAELALSVTATLGVVDPVRDWDVPAQLDRGLGRARCLQRMVKLGQWRDGEERFEADRDHDSASSRDHGRDRDCWRPQGQTAVSADAAAYLFAAIMNLEGLVLLPAEAHVFRLWYLASHAANPWGAARRMFGDLRDLPLHQQLAVGARTLDRLDQKSDAAVQKDAALPKLLPAVSVPDLAPEPAAATACVRPFSPEPVIQDRSWLLAA